MPPPHNDIRNDIDTTTARPICATAFTPTRRQRYRTPACKQAAWRARNPDQRPSPSIVVPPRTNRHDITVYQRPGYDNHSLGEQWCHDCNPPCIRIDLGGLRPNCDQPITIRDITDQH